MPAPVSAAWAAGFKSESAGAIAGIYRDSIERNSNLLLNLSPDKTGRLPEEAVTTMREVALRIRTASNKGTV